MIDCGIIFVGKQNIVTRLISTTMTMANRCRHEGVSGGYHYVLKMAVIHSVVFIIEVVFMGCKYQYCRL